jgi:FixJ family two-component response regulator
MSLHPATVFLIDDDAAVRDALSRTLKLAGLSVETFGCAEDFLAVYDPDRPSCLLLDVHMPGMSGLELQQQLASREMPVSIIFLSGQGDIPMTVKAVKAGAIDFLPKPFRSQDLLERVREAMAQDAKSRREHKRAGLIKARFGRLSPREREVMAAVVTGQSSKEIARQLGVSHRTVEIHRTRVMQKMEADSLPELVTQAVACGVLDLPN